jgi:Mce-associated membrane protein
VTDIATRLTDVGQPADEPPLASWTRRVIAALLDDAVLGGAAWLVLGIGGAAPSMAPFVPMGTGPENPVSWLTSGWLVAVFVGYLALQGYTGATPGKRVAGVAIVRASDGLPIGFVASVGRVLAHALDAIFLIGYLRPLWNTKRQTFADSIVGTLALQTREPPAHPWFARFRREPSAARSTVVSVGATILVLLGVGFSTTSYASGSTEQSAIPCVDDGTVADATASAAAARTRSWSLERRLWVSRTDTLSDETGLSLTWSVLSSAPDAGGAQVETDLQRADGSVIQETQEGLSVTSWDSGEIVFGPTPVPLGDLEAAGPGWMAHSQLVVDGEVVGACTVDGADWTSATFPPVPEG